MAGRTKRERSKSPQQLALTSARVFAIAFALSIQLQTLCQPALSNTAKTLKQRLLVREQILLQGHANRANQVLISNIEALANRLPVLLSYSRSQGTQNLNENEALLQDLDKVAGPNPFEQEPELKTELERSRLALEAEGVGKVNDGLRQKNVATSRSRAYFCRPTMIHPTEPLRTIDTLIVEEGSRWPGTINILIDCTGNYVVFATGLDGRQLKQDNKTICKSGHLN